MKKYLYILSLGIFIFMGLGRLDGISAPSVEVGACPSWCANDPHCKEDTRCRRCHYSHCGGRATLRK